LSELRSPPEAFAKQPLRTLQVGPSSLIRVSSYASGEPHFNRKGGGRFDHPLSSRKRPYGTCYLAFDLITAIAETVLHDENPVGGFFRVAHTEVLRRYVVHFGASKPLVAADLTGAALKTTVGSPAISALATCEQSQQWGRALHDHPQKIDAILYMSRHMNDRKALVVFDRARHKLVSATARPLLDEPGCAGALSDLRVVFDYG